MADGTSPDPRLLRAIARAWDWRRRLDRGEVATIKDIAAAEGVTDAFVSRFLRLAYLAPDVLERLLIHRRPCALPLDCWRRPRWCRGRSRLGRFLKIDDR